MDTAVAVTRRPLPAPRVAAVDAAAPNATILEREDVSTSVTRIRVRPDGGVPPFRPGQYFALGIAVAGRPLQRPYSTASATGEADALEFLVRLVPGGELTPLLWRLRVGDRVRLGRPRGLFVPEPNDARRAVYVATGTGIAPLLSMLESSLAGTDARPAGHPPIVVHGVSRPVDLAYRARLEALAAAGRIRYVPAVSRPDAPGSAGWAGAIGRVDGLLPGLLAEAAIDPAHTVAFVCGNPGMTETVTGSLRARGLPDAAIRSEAYWVASAPGEPAA